jgi:hypothetical protein
MNVRIVKTATARFAVDLDTAIIDVLNPLVIVFFALPRENITIHILSCVNIAGRKPVVILSHITDSFKDNWH